MKILVGADPEVFITNTHTQETISAIGLIPGDKDNPYKISDLGHAIQTDNVMAEFCIPPSSSSEELYNNIQFCLRDINNRLPKGVEVDIKASATLLPKYLRSKKAKLFGCDPDYNAYTFEPNTPPEAKKNNMRSAGGHIHIGYDNPSFLVNMDIIKAMDLFLGIPSLILDKDTERRKMYGKAGCFREKAYGVEYRTLSNFWIKSPELVSWAYEQTIEAVNFVLNGGKISDETQVKVQLAINTFDLTLAEELIKEFNLVVDLKHLQKV